MGSTPTHLTETSEEYRRLKQEHADYSKRLDEIGTRRFPTPEEQAEEARLKKMKLQLKDRMQRLLSDQQGAASRPALPST